jgi:hypothetical protein
MDKDRIAAIAARGEQIKTSSVEYLWICRGIRPPLLPEPPKPIAQPGVDPEDRHLRRLNSSGLWRQKTGQR